MEAKIGIIGKGNVGSAPQRGLARAGHEVRTTGKDSGDAGQLRNARWLEALGYLNILLGYVQKLGPDIGFRVVR